MSAPESKAVTDLKEATREAHEAIKDLRALLKDCHSARQAMESTRDELLSLSHEVFDQRMNEQVEDGLNTYRQTLDKALEDSTDAVFARFDRLFRVMMGTGTKQDLEAMAVDSKVARGIKRG